MKKRNKDIILFIILIPLFLWGAFYISSRIDNQLPPFSVINKARSGSSVFFEALGKLGYSVERTLKPIKEHDAVNVQIVVHNSGFDVNSEEVKQWIRKGGILVYLTPLNTDFVSFAEPYDERAGMRIYKYAAGSIITADAYSITNNTLLKDTHNAYKLLEEIDSRSYSRLYFNEAHMFTEAYKSSLWDYTPIGIKLLLYQLIIAALAYVYYKSKRFGKTIPLYEEVERTENEYLYSASALYRQAKCWDLMLESYYVDFLNAIKCRHDNWLDYWEKEQLPNFSKAKAVHSFMCKPNKNKKDNIHIISTIDQLKYIIKRRRDSYWKTIKKSM